jgi:hypothetical protein
MTKTMPSHSSKLQHALAILLATFFVTVSSGVTAQVPNCSTITAGNNATISASCNDLILDGAGAVGINSDVTVGEFFAFDQSKGAVTVSQSSTSLTNSGTIEFGQGTDGIGVRVLDGVTLQFLTNSSSANIRENVNTLGGQPYGIYNSGTIGTLNNQGSITGLRMYSGIYNIGTITNLTNSGIISAGYSTGIDNEGAIVNLTNSETISGDVYGIYNRPSSIISTLINSGSISGGSDGILSLFGNISTLTNTGTISGSSANGIYNLSTVTALSNSGTISGGNNGIRNRGTITDLTNTGTIAGTSGHAVYNDNGTITTLNNLQGVGNAAGALTYRGRLPTNYNIIIGSANSYGQLSGSSVTGSTNFGIYAGATITTKLYTGVLQGLTTSNVGATRTGTYSGLNYTLALQSGSSTIWDLIFTGASTDDTQKSIVATAASLQDTFALQNSVLANSLGYDCNKFGNNGVCISTGGRYTAVSAADGLNNTSALLIGAYRLNQNYRIGAYVDQNLFVNNAGSTVRLGNNTPLIGLFGAWNEKPDGTGTEVKVSAAYGKKNTTVNRQIVNTSEPGSGSSQLSSQGAQVTAKHGFTVTDKAIVSPYIGMRYTQNNMGGYTEGSSEAVTAPLAFSALNTRATTALAGVGVNYKVNPTVTTFASAGIEADTKTGNGSYSGTNSNISGLTAVNFNANPVKVRASAVLGAYYDMEKNQRFAITGIYREEAYRSVNTTAVFATYTVGL